MHISKDNAPEMSVNNNKESVSKEQWWGALQQPKANQMGEVTHSVQKLKENTAFNFIPQHLPMASNPMNTPLKGYKSFDENGKMRNQSMNLIDEIKKIVTSESQTDRVKVGCLKRILGLQEENQ